MLKTESVFDRIHAASRREQQQAHATMRQATSRRFLVEAHLPIPEMPTGVTFENTKCPGCDGTDPENCPELRRLARTYGIEEG